MTFDRGRRAESEQPPPPAYLRQDFVVLFRASLWEVKGLAFIIDVLAAKPPARPTTPLIVDKRRLLGRLRRDYRILDLGWVEDDALSPQAFAACDVFLMPSLAEGFGLMAVEAMAAGRPVVCSEGTALPARDTRAGMWDSSSRR